MAAMAAKAAFDASGWAAARRRLSALCCGFLYDIRPLVRNRCWAGVRSAAAERESISALSIAANANAAVAPLTTSIFHLPHHCRRQAGDGDVCSVTTLNGMLGMRQTGWTNGAATSCHRARHLRLPPCGVSLPSNDENEERGETARCNISGKSGGALATGRIPRAATLRLLRRERASAGHNHTCCGTCGGRTKASAC